MRKIILSLVTLFAISAGVNAQIPTAGLVGQYDFTNGALTDNINSVSFTKTGTASTTITDRFGNANRAISLNGDDLLRSDIDFDVSNANPYLPRTVSFWMKTSTNNGNLRYIYGDNDQANAGDIDFNGLSVVFQNGQIKAFNRVGTNGNVITHSAIVSDDVWHHIVVQAYSTNISGAKRFFTYIYIDAVKEGGIGYITSSGSVDVRVNEHVGDIVFSRLETMSMPSNSKYEDGLDEVLFYTSVLTDAEVNAITYNGYCTVNIPDANFRTYLLGNAAINTNGNTVIECSEASAFTGVMNCGSLSIADLTGIEAFTGLTELHCYGNSLTSLDVTQNTALTTLACSNNSIGSLDVSNNAGLTYLACGMNSLSSLDVSNNTNLIELYCNDNSIGSLNLFNNTYLSIFDCSTNALSSLDVTQNTGLTIFYCEVNSISNLDLSVNTSLTEFGCSSNTLTSLNVANGNNINLPNFYATNNPNLVCIQVDDVAYSTTNWTSIDAASNFSTNCSSTCTINIPDANFKAYLVGNSAINTSGDTEIQCYEASFFSGAMDCSSLGITDLTGIEEFTALTELDCSSNPLGNLDVSQNTHLSVLYCITTSLSSLDVSQNTALTILGCQNNSLSNLDVSQNTALTSLGCHYNDLSSLNVANGNNVNISIIDARFNSNLTCIQVDDATYSTNNWIHIDAIASFSTNCSGAVLVSSITVQGQNGASTITTPAGTLQMEATVLPANADDATYTWSVSNGTGSATIAANGLLTAVTDGTVEVTATANDASGETGEVVITISNQTAGIDEVALNNVNIYPNPVQNELFVELTEGQITEINILDLSGKVMKSITNSANSIDVSDLSQGVYILKVATEKSVSTKRFVKK